jgi:hypothetical protein
MTQNAGAPWYTLRWLATSAAPQPSELAIDLTIASVLAAGADEKRRSAGRTAQPNALASRTAIVACVGQGSVYAPVSPAILFSVCVFVSMAA